MPRYSCVSFVESSACRAAQRVDEPADRRERGAELVARDGDEVGLQLVQLPEPLQHLLLVRRAGGRPATTSETWSASRTELEQTLRSIEPGCSLPRSCRTPDHGVTAARSGTTASAGPAAGSAAPSPRPGRERLAPGDERLFVPGSRGRRRRPGGEAVSPTWPRLEQQDAERVALHLAADRLGDLLERLPEVRGVGLGQDRGVERRQVAVAPRARSRRRPRRARRRPRRPPRGPRQRRLLAEGVSRTRRRPAAMTVRHHRRGTRRRAHEVIAR